jgi:1,4-dihydroxy-2-naphthoate polyprenyltransferase
MTMGFKLKVWWLASRPKTLPAALAPVLIGTAMAFGDDKGHLLSALLAACGALLIQIGTNFANDYFDFVQGADDHTRTGPTRATQAGWVKPSAMRTAFILTFALAAGIGAYLVWRGGWPIAMIGAFSILFGIIYTGGPYPLGYYGLGDIAVFIFFGLVAVGGTYYVQALEWPAIVWISGIAPGLFSVAILDINNYRDIHSDRKAGKRTLVVRFGPGFAKVEYAVCIIFGSLTPLALITYFDAPVLSALSSLTLLAAIPTLRKVFSLEPGPVYNTILAETGRLLLLYSILFSMGWFL